MNYNKIVILVTGLLLMALGIRMFMLAGKSNQTPSEKVGIVEGHLNVCGEKPNCVSTQADPSSNFYIEPLTGENVESLWDNLNMILPEMGFKMISTETGYIHCTETSRLFGFVDDIEFLLIPDKGEIEMRSQSRVGYSDMGVNRKRLEKIRKALQPK